MKYSSLGLFSAKLVPAVNYPRIIYGSRTKICVTGLQKVCGCDAAPLMAIEGGGEGRKGRKTERGGGGEYILTKFISSHSTVCKCVCVCGVCVTDQLFSLIQYRNRR